ncbi:ISAs1 family transposase [Microbulbifer sp. EKSA008]|uniref:ISAs1 family transposase n=1 Tax=Microbulbifer sp. EKSA008 TaxID=3243367 RepID=UPI004041BB6F
MDSVSLLHHFDDMEDPRVDRHKLHALPDILLIMFCGVICGAESCRDFVDFAESKLDYLKRFTPLNSGIPSKNTFSRVISSLDPEQFKRCFLQWVQGIQQELGNVIAIDGKTLRRSFDQASKRSPIHMVSAFASEARLVLAQQKVEEKSNEITAIPKLLEVLDLNGAIITLDAMGCQKTITQKIIERGGDYVIAVKGNQDKLHQQITTHFNNLFDMQYHKHVDTDCVEEVSRGRIESRKCLSTNSIDWLGGEEQWHGLRSVIAVQAKRTVDGRTSCETRYYISSLEPCSAELNHIIRSHWGVENSLHWILDVVFREDDSRFRSGNAPENMAILRHSALNQLQAAKPSFKKDMNIKRLRKKAGWDNETLDKIITATI